MRSVAGSRWCWPTCTRQDAATPTAYLRLLLAALQKLRFHTEGVDLFRLAVQGWAHAQSRPKTKAMIMASFQRLLAVYAEAATRWTTRADAPALATAIGGAVIGYLVQSTFSEQGIDPKLYFKGCSRTS